MPSKPVVPRVQRHRLHTFAPTFWATAGVAAEADAPSSATPTSSDPTATPDPLPVVSVNAQCTTCHLHFDDAVEQRAHFRSDFHKYNTHRRSRRRAAVTRVVFDDLSDLGSVGSLSGSDSASSDDDGNSTHTSISSPSPSTDRVVSETGTPRVEFAHPTEASFVLVYRALLPDPLAPRSLSLSARAAHAVVMAASGHFCLALWDGAGILVRHKTIHKYTTRRKQGGSQAAADAARGAGNRIRSAGATLRRHGEHALQSEVRNLLTAWASDLSECAAVFVRAGRRDKQTLLLYDDSPLTPLVENGRLRNIPFPTRRPTLKEAQRVYDELTTVLISPVSLARINRLAREGTANVREKPAPAPVVTKPTAPPGVKGTDHLKKREKPRREPSASPAPSQASPDPPPPLDEARQALLALVLADDRTGLSARFVEEPTAPTMVLAAHELTPHAALAGVDATEGVGLVAIAAATGQPELLTWLLEHDADPALGVSPYLVTKAKATRTALRAFWGTHPDRYDFKKAGVPTPLSQADIEAAAERERAKRRKERAKKKEKALERVEAAKPLAVRARELRAAAAEARLLGNRCAYCKKNLSDMSATFERLAFKYCSTECVAKHRAALNA